MAVDSDRLADRLAAVERRLTDADDDALSDVAAVEGRLAELEDRTADLDGRVEELERGLQAVRGYVGGVDAVDASVERRADAALAKVEALERHLDDDPDLTVERLPVDGTATDGTATDGTATGEAGPFSAAPGDDADDRRLVDRLRDVL